MADQLHMVNSFSIRLGEALSMFELQSDDCKFDDLVNAADKLMNELRPDVLLGEATTVDVVLYRELVRRPSRRIAPQP